MKRVVALFVSAALFGLVACSHEQTTKPVAEQPAINTNQADISQAQQEINSLQSRLDSLKDKNWHKYGANHQNMRRLVNDQYAKLGVAKQELKDLEAAKPEDFQARDAQLEATLASIRNALDTNHLAE